MQIYLPKWVPTPSYVYVELTGGKIQIEYFIRNTFLFVIWAFSSLMKLTMNKLE